MKAFFLLLLLVLARLSTTAANAPRRAQAAVVLAPAYGHPAGPHLFACWLPLPGCASGVRGGGGPTL